MLRRIFAQPRAWLDAVLAPAEDPRQAFTSPALRHEQLMAQLRHSLELVADSRRRLSTRAAEAEARLPELEARARHAVMAGRSDLARLVLQRRRLAAADLSELRRQVEDLDAEEQRLGLVEQKVTGAVEAYRAKQEMAVAKYNAAAAQVKIGEALAGVSTDLGDLGVGLEEAEEQAERMEARAGAIDRLLTEGSLEAGMLPLDPLLDAEVEAQLAALEATLR